MEFTLGVRQNFIDSNICDGYHKCLGGIYNKDASKCQHCAELRLKELNAAPKLEMANDNLNDVQQKEEVDPWERTGRR